MNNDANYKHDSRIIDLNLEDRIRSQKGNECTISGNPFAVPENVSKESPREAQEKTEGCYKKLVLWNEDQLSAKEEMGKNYQFAGWK